MCQSVDLYHSYAPYLFMTQKLRNSLEVGGVKDGLKDQNYYLRDSHQTVIRE